MVEAYDIRMTISVRLLFGWGLPDTIIEASGVDAFAVDGRVQW